MRHSEPSSTKWIILGASGFLAIIFAIFLAPRLLAYWQMREFGNALQHATEQSNRDLAQQRRATERRRQQGEARKREHEARMYEARRLKPGERCMGNKFVREIPGGFEDDPAQDWKCRASR